MVSKSDVSYYKSNNSGRGESRSSTKIITATENNYFDSVTASEEVGGHIEYRVFYVTNDHATEKMEDCEIWLSSDNPNSGFSHVQWAIDPIAQHPIWPFHPYPYGDGSSGYVDLGNQATLWSQALTKFSFSIWVFPTAGATGTDQYIFCHGAASNHGKRIIMDASDPTLVRFQIKSSTATNIFASSTGLNLNQWNHIVCVYNSTLGSANLKIYVNNVVGSVTGDLTETINLSAVAELLGHSSSNFCQGYIKDFRWFNNKALSTSQIDDIFNGEDDAVTADYWQIMEEGTGTMVDEKTAKVGTLTGGAEWRTSQEIASSTTSPIGVTWNGVTNGPIVNFPNLGDIAANGGRQCPIWVKWIVEDTEQDAENDYCLFVVQGKIPSGASPPTDPTDPTVPGPVAEDFTFAACGDWGDESMTTTVVNRIKNNSPKPIIVLGLGDNAYDSGSDKVKDWEDRIDPLDGKNGIKFYTTFGNHDNAESESSSNETELKNHFGLSKTYYTFDNENVRFICVDNTTETSFSSGSDQYNKVKDWLKTGRENPNIDWIVVFGHKPMFGGSSRHDYNDGNFNQALWPLFDQYKVDLMLFGHNHHMAQSKQVKYNSNNAESPTIVDSATPYTGGAGRIHCVVGTGGHDAGDLYGVSSFSQTEWKNDTDHGALFVTISNSGSTTTLTGRFKDTDGSTLRTFVINR